MFEGTINAATFNSWIEQDLLPKLPQKSVVSMDNAAFHKDKGMRSVNHGLRDLVCFWDDIERQEFIVVIRGFAGPDVIKQIS